jgi:hypothetical protein
MNQFCFLLGGEGVDECILLLNFTQQEKIFNPRLHRGVFRVELLLIMRFACLLVVDVI